MVGIVVFVSRYSDLKDEYSNSPKQNHHSPFITPSDHVYIRLQHFVFGFWSAGVAGFRDMCLGLKPRSPEPY